MFVTLGEVHEIAVHFIARRIVGHHATGFLEIILGNKPEGFGRKNCHLKSRIIAGDGAFTVGTHRMVNPRIIFGYFH